jgi:hypothetical protein
MNFDEEMLQSYVRGPSAVEEEEPSRLYQQPQPKPEEEKKKKDKKPAVEKREQEKPSWMRRKNVIVIEQRKVKTVPLAIDECYCDKDRAAAVSFGTMDIKHDLKTKITTEKQKVRILPDDGDAVAFLMLGMREIKNNNIDNGVRFLNKVVLGVVLGWFFIPNCLHHNNHQFYTILGHRDVAQRPGCAHRTLKVLPAAGRAR